MTQVNSSKASKINLLDFKTPAHAGIPHHLDHVLPLLLRLVWYRTANAGGT